MTWVLVLGLLINVIALPIAARRVVWLIRLIRSGQPEPGRVEGVTGRLGRAAKNQLVEVFGQQRLLTWTVPGAAHFFVFWAFVILGSVYVEAYGVLLISDEFAIPLIGHWEVLGFLQDLIAVLAVISLGVFAQIRLKNAPEKLGRTSRFKGSHLGGAWLVLFMIFNVIWTMFLFRGAASAAGNLPYDSGAFLSVALGNLFDGLSEDTVHVLEGIGLLLHIGVMLVFLVIVLNSKHLHIFVAPLNVLFKRQPRALGAAKPLTSGGKPVTLDDLEEMDEETTLGIGSIEDFSWKGLLDMATCTECGRCQSQCPAWNTEKPLSPKMLIMNLRDHAFHIGSYLQADEAKRTKLLEDDPELAAEVERALVGATEGEAWEPTGGGIIDPDVLWSCVTCGACVQQCPVDIEHVDHIVDMRRYQVLVENNFPAELNQLFKGMESKGNPWNLSPNMRLDWAQGLDFDVPVVGEDLESLESVDWLFWVGCAGAYEDRAKKTTRAVAELLHLAGVSFGVLGKGETCTGDSARRAGNEFVFQGLAQQNVETFKEYQVKQVVSTCAHCFNTLKNEYQEFGIELEVVHHTQLLNRLVREGRLTPVQDGAGAAKRSITYHDPCYIGRHNQVYSPPRELLQVLPGAEFVEMERNSERSFCCGAGGARMWMEETIGERINLNRTTEAVGTGADQIAVGCPFCRVMLSDGLSALQDSGDAREEVEVLDVAQMLLASVKGEVATRTSKVAASSTPAATATQVEERGAPATSHETPEPSAPEPTADAPAAGSLFDVEPAEPTAPEVEERGAPATSHETPATSTATPATEIPQGGSLFDVEPAEPAAPEKEATPAAPAAKPTGGSLFDVEPAEPAAPEKEATPAAPAAKPTGGSLFDVEPAEPTAPEKEATPAAPAAQPTGGSLFDVEPAKPAAPEVEERGAPATSHETPATSTATPATEIPQGGSLFDVEPAEPAGPEVEERGAPATSHETPATSTATPATEIPQGGSLFDIAEPGAAAAPPPEPPPEPDPEPEAEADAEATADEPDEPTVSDTGAVDPTALSQAATAVASDDTAAEQKTSEPEGTAEPQAEESDESEETDESDQEAPPKPAPSGDAHQPRTDADINQGGSLFDL